MTTATIAYVGNFRPEHSTENHVRQAAERLGHTVLPLQEDSAGTWERLRDADRPPGDVLLWTRTGWDWPAAAGWTWEQATDNQLLALGTMARLGVPTVGYHLDRWWGLDREGQVRDEAFFRCGLVVTADGGHDDDWAAAGVHHRWLPPGVLLAECEREARPRSEYARHHVVFVGSWRHYHPEWLQHRRTMIARLQRRYARRFGLYPRGQALRGAELTDLYAAAKVVAGDSCLAGGATHYWSDRIPETVGRGGVLVHPHVDGLADHYTPGEHLVTYPLGDWDTMLHAIDELLADAGWRDRIRKAGRAHVMEHHTYERRVQQLLAMVGEL